jgi:hypothetical protein
VTGVGEKTAGRMVLGGGAENRAHACSIQSVGVGLLEERLGEERRGMQSSSPVRSPVPAFPCMAGLGRGEEESAAIEHEESDTRKMVSPLAVTRFRRPLGETNHN